MCCTQLAGNAGPKNSPKNRLLGTIPQFFSDYVFATKAHIDNWKKILMQQYLLHKSLQYGELRHTSGWDRFTPLQISTGFTSWQRYCTALQYSASAKLCGV